MKPVSYLVQEVSQLEAHMWSHLLVHKTQRFVNVKTGGSAVTFSYHYALEA
jgi:hypothetical protein